MKSLEMTAASKHSPTHTQVTFRFPVQREYLNPGGTLHGAAQSLFFDVCTTWLLGPIARKPDYWCSFGTSRSLNVVYLRPAREGDVLTLECEVSCSFPVLFALDCLGMGFGRFWFTGC
jgi:acyl-coenzyme A thioesterase 13